MPPLPAPLERLSALTTGRNASRLSIVIVIALCAGLLLPALIGGMALTALRQAQIDKEMESHLQDKLTLLVKSLADPVWNIDTLGTGTIAESALLDPSIVRLTIRDPADGLILQVERPERRTGLARSARLPIIANHTEIGSLEIETDDGVRQSEFQADRRAYYLLFVGMFVTSLTLILVSLHKRVLRPLRRLMDFSNQLSEGDLDHPIDWRQPDEIGRLAEQLDRMRDRLKNSFAEQQAILDNVQLGVVFARERIIQLANRHAETIFGYGPGEMNGQCSRILYASEAHFVEVGARAYRAIATENAIFEEELGLKRRDGTIFWARLRGCALNPAKPQGGSIWVFEDITEKRHAADQLRLAATVFENTADAVMITDVAHDIVAVNRGFQLITGYSQEEALGRNASLVKPVIDGRDAYETIVRSLAEQRRWQGEILNRRKNGEVFPVEMTVTAVVGRSGLVERHVAVFNDVTFRKAAEEEIRKLAFYDTLTRLPNRRLMLDRLGRALTSSARHHRHGALMLIDLDNFKTLNDTLGHDVGDQLLLEVANRLQSCIRKGDTVARMGGDEFVVVLEELDSGGLAAMQAESVARKIQNLLNEPYLLDLALPGETANLGSHRCTSSIGIALFIDNSVGVDELMKRADTAMYQAKAAGRNTMRFFDPEMQAAVNARAVLEVDLRRAIEERQFVLYYQPQLDADNRVIGGEALLRWQHPRRGLVGPNEFIRTAEDTGLIIPIGQWVLETACEQLAAWSKRPQTAQLSLALNVSARQFHNVDFIFHVVSALERTGANPQRLKLELTESLLLDDVEDVIDKMNMLKELGAGFSLDDFGTGYSSLAYLKRLPLDQLKIDRSFVRDVLTDANDASIARTVVVLAQNLGLSVIAEGVETEGQRDFLIENGCRAFQGYLFSRPLPLADFETYVSARAP
ncbi:MAG: EAL domain-containing protein [Propionivibrio sp.]